MTKSHEMWCWRLSLYVCDCCIWKHHISAILHCTAIFTHKFFQKCQQLKKNSLPLTRQPHFSSLPLRKWALWKRSQFPLIASHKKKKITPQIKTFIFVKLQKIEFVRYFHEKMWKFLNINFEQIYLCYMKCLVLKNWN